MEVSCPTKESDCYALGMVVFEVLSGQVPYAQYQGAALVHKVLDGERPRRPRGDRGRLFTDGIWGAVQLCWKEQPSDRTNAKAVFLSLERDSSPSRSSSSMGGYTEKEKGVDGQSDVTLGYFSMFALFLLRSQAHGVQQVPRSSAVATNPRFRGHIIVFTK